MLCSRWPEEELAARLLVPLRCSSPPNVGMSPIPSIRLGPPRVGLAEAPTCAEISQPPQCGDQRVLRPRQLPSCGTRARCRLCRALARQPGTGWNDRIGPIRRSNDHKSRNTRIDLHMDIRGWPAHSSHRTVRVHWFIRRIRSDRLDCSDGAVVGCHERGRPDLFGAAASRATADGSWITTDDTDPSTGGPESMRVWMVAHDGMTFGAGWYNDGTG